MFGLHQDVVTRKPQPQRINGQKLVGYILTAKHVEQSKEAVLRLEDRCHNSGYKLEATEWDVGSASNPYRVGLWRTLRRMICLKCEPRRMSFSMMSFDDFLHQGLSPCPCGAAEPADGVIVSRLEHISSNRIQGSTLVLKLAKLGKHVIAEDGICLSCCHPAAKDIINRTV